MAIPWEAITISTNLHHDCDRFLRVCRRSQILRLVNEKIRSTYPLDSETHSYRHAARLNRKSLYLMKSVHHLRGCEFQHLSVDLVVHSQLRRSRHLLNCSWPIPVILGRDVQGATSYHSLSAKRTPRLGVATRPASANQNVEVSKPRIIRQKSTTNEVTRMVAPIRCMRYRTEQ